MQIRFKYANLLYSVSKIQVGGGGNIHWDNNMILPFCI